METATDKAKNDPRLIEWYQATPNLGQEESTEFLQAAKDYIYALYHYLDSTICAKQNRGNGSIADALRQEENAEYHYHQLPDLAKW